MINKILDLLASGLSFSIVVTWAHKRGIDLGSRGTSFRRSRPGLTLPALDGSA